MSYSQNLAPAKAYSRQLFRSHPLLDSASTRLLTAQICAAHLRRSGKIWSSARELHTASFEHVGKIGEPQSHGSHLLDQYAVRQNDKVIEAYLGVAESNEAAVDA
jgi:hypothetical protein